MGNLNSNNMSEGEFALEDSDVDDLNRRNNNDYDQYNRGLSQRGDNEHNQSQGKVKTMGEIHMPAMVERKNLK